MCVRGGVAVGGKVNSMTREAKALPYIARVITRMDRFHSCGYVVLMAVT